MPLVLFIQSIRPRQWTKNLVLFAALIFAQQADQPRLVLASIVGFALFCMFSGVVYLLNDLKDRASDAAHPTKRDRPIASGRLSSRHAWTGLIILLVVGLLGASRLGSEFLLVGVGYLLLNVLYSFVLRSLVLLDVMSIAAGFVLRAIAGAEILTGQGLPVTISPWLLICTFFLSLFLGLGKRRHEAAASGSNHRATLRYYSVALTDKFISMTAAITVLSYSIYTIWPDTVAKFGTTRLVFTVPFVFYGIARYLQLVTEENKGGDPSEMLLTEKSIILTVLCWSISVAWILFWS